MHVRDPKSLQVPVLMGNAGAPLPMETQYSEGRRRCSSLRSDRNFSLGFALAFVSASGVMAKALENRIAEYAVDDKPVAAFVSKGIVMAPLGIAALFLKSAYHQDVLYRQCLQNPREILARIAAEAREAEESKDAKRVSLSVSEVARPVGWIAVAAVAIERVVHYSAAAVEGALASGPVFCSPGLRYFEFRKRNDLIL